MAVPANPSVKDGALSTLVTLISEATKVVEAYYAASSKPHVPSLDDTEEHPLDSQISPPELRKAVQTIEAACAQLCATVTKPRLAIVNRESEIYAPPCLNAALRLKVADVLLTKPEGIHISEIASIVNVDANKLGRMLRLLATKHVFREVAPNVFANNRLSMQLLTSSPLWNLGIIMTDELGRTAGEITSVLQDPEWGPSTDLCHTAFNRYTGFKGNLFEYFESGPTGAKLGTIFGLGMVGYSSAIEADIVVHEYPWHELPSGATVCDIGGGVGHMAIKLAKAHHHLNLKLQDLPVRIAQAKAQVWPASCPEALATGQIEFKAMDFFKEPPIPGCDVYYMKHVIHNWSDEQCITILKNIRKVMKPESRLLIHEFVAQHASRGNGETPTEFQAPEPLLANYGVARFQTYGLDIAMMSLLNARERLLEELVEIAEAADLEFAGMRDFDQLSIVEFCPKGVAKL